MWLYICDYKHNQPDKSTGAKPLAKYWRNMKYKYNYQSTLSNVGPLLFGIVGNGIVRLSEHCVFSHVLQLYGKVQVL